ncbi:polyprenol phosphomannose-dependent alpha 1,6 mannosyltransferase MptB [Corynebacterium aquatimens]|uniref:Alpha-1,6-mannosyltransferase n=1 Tax=Corynebacterium aquatimens TaxID=1190508 RepID=A0A931GR76_9CORY|nr:polyprenol phosphomannose-dependent alpha 1,6 mannosyltransferase MptB [Corynebacterium aquatimens]MBG6121648.1 alpha-1,6-mannosyltransferase [Corynebacterium aquatimens]
MKVPTPRLRLRAHSTHTSVKDELPRLGAPGSRSSELHTDRDVGIATPTIRERNRFEQLRIVGMIGTLLMALGGLGGGALPVVNNPYNSFALGAVMGRALQTSSSLVLIGVAMVVFSWVLMTPFVGALGGQPLVQARTLLRTFFVWVIPLIVTAPLFTQDIYSYLAQGKIVALGLDPYSAGPTQILGIEDPLGRSVPFIWAESPSPYGPVALAIAAGIFQLTGDSIFWGVTAHRLVSLVGVCVASWAIIALAKRCGVAPPTAVWLGILNPLVILHLIAGIHNEAIMMGLLLLGVEIGLRGIDIMSRPLDDEEPAVFRGYTLLILSGVLISAAGMVKVSAFIALGFVGMAYARKISGARGLLRAIGLQTAVMVGTIAAATALTGIGLGWVTGQGGAASIRSWLSVSTEVGVAAGLIAQLLGLGDHTDAMLGITRTVALLIAAAFCVRMLWATYRGTIHPVGGLGVATLVLVLLFPVVHPWYPLWAILPLAAWANRRAFRAFVVLYCGTFSFLVLPRGLALPPGTVVTIYFMWAAGIVFVAALCWCGLKLSRSKVLH